MRFFFKINYLSIVFQHKGIEQEVTILRDRSNHLQGDEKKHPSNDYFRILFYELTIADKHSKNLLWNKVPTLLKVYDEQMPVQQGKRDVLHRK